MSSGPEGSRSHGAKAQGAEAEGTRAASTRPEDGNKRKGAEPMEREATAAEGAEGAISDSTRPEGTERDKSGEPEASAAEGSGVHELSASNGRKVKRQKRGGGGRREEAKPGVLLSEEDKAAARLSAEARKVEARQRKGELKDRAMREAKEAGLGVVKLGSMGIVFLSLPQHSHSDAGTPNSDSVNVHSGSTCVSLSQAAHSDKAEPYADPYHVQSDSGTVHSGITRPHSDSTVVPELVRSLTAVLALHERLASGTLKPLQFCLRILPVLGTCAADKAQLGSLVRRLARTALPWIASDESVGGRRTEGVHKGAAEVAGGGGGGKGEGEEERGGGGGGKGEGEEERGGGGRVPLRFAVGFKRRGHEQGGEGEGHKQGKKGRGVGERGGEGEDERVEGGSGKRGGEDELGDSEEVRREWISTIAAAFKEGAGHRFEAVADLKKPEVACIVEVLKLAQGPPFCAVSLIPSTILEVKPRLAVKSTALTGKFK